MDRRNRFIPWSDRLEGRQLMTAAAAVLPQAAYATMLANTPTSTPATVKGHARPARALSAQTAFEASVTGTRQNRIKQLPGYLLQINPNRRIPASLIQALQADMQTIQGTLTAPPQPLVNAMKDALKDAATTATISENNAKGLSHQFGMLLQYSGAAPDVTAQFQKDVNQLVRLNTQARNPALTTANDYGLMTQYVLSVGRKINPHANAAAVQAAAAKKAGGIAPNVISSPVSSSGM